MSTLPELVLAQAARRPETTAVRQWDERLGYAELAETATRLAARLRAHGVGPEHRVGLCLRRRPPMVAGMLGVLLAGGAYVPLDPDGPAARRAEIIADADIDVVVVDESTARLFDGQGPQAVPVAGAPADGAPADGDGRAGQVVCPAGPDNAAYVLYTSGSTGRPKGVVVTHRSLVSYALAFAEFTGAEEHTRSFGFASLGFDVSVLDILVPLAVGGSVQLAGEADRTDPERLQRFAASHQVTWGCVPVALLPLLDPAGLPEWRTVITGAEAPGPEQVERWSGSGRRFLNCYGPTEATVCVTAFEAGGRWERPLPIGRALAGHRVHVVDEELRPVPPGEPGELLIGGAGLARGYLGDPALTAERFVPDPFGDRPGERLYRTGDLVVLQPDGELLFLGRTDRQIKIRGQRVEIGEVEAVMRAHPEVGHAVVEAVEGPDGVGLVAFCTSPAASSGEVPDAERLRAYCAERLPSAMVPSRVVCLVRLPLSASGKVDGQALRALLEHDTTATGTAPGTPLERDVAAIWARVLGLPAEKVSLEDDFFACGGHSVTAMRLVAGVRAELDRAVSVEDVFAGRTLSGLAARIEDAAERAEPLPSGSPATLSAAQRRLWFVDKLAPDTAAYNIALAERLHGPLDVAALRAALAAVAARHDVLRWRVPDTGGMPYVEVDPPGAVPLHVDDLTGAPESASRALLDEEAAHRFDLATGPLWRARLARLGPAEHLLALTFHHAVFDGWSQRPFLEDLGRAYAHAAGGENPVALPDPPARFADYVVWRAARDTRRGDADLAWWAAHLADAPAVLDLPRDRARPPVQTYRGAQSGIALSAATSAAIRALAAGVGTTAPTVLLAGFAELVRRITRRGDVVVGTPAADRRHEAFHDLVGFFVEVVPLRLRSAAGESFAERVRGCADEFLAVLARPGATLERIVDALALPRDPARAPLVQVLFNVYNFPEPRLRLPGVRTERVAPGLAGSPFDLTVYVVDRDGGYAVDCVYNADLYTPQRIQALLEAYASLLDQASAAPERPVDAHELPGAATLAVGVAAEPAKVTRTKAVPAGAPGTSARPSTATERLIAQVWCEVLDRPEVGAADNFFDVGGTSMAVVVVQDRLAELTGRKLAVVELFRHPTVRALAAHLDGDTEQPELDRADQRAAARRQRAEQRKRRSQR
ncbi:amino acid adenylation domain-containing protein [Microtetraspora sp. NBRC 16547]|uniref:amino acid adenylation domain-containing protein n=1 Tax=Microtetraspora sp. NBRC 16547 TaxID=3030993 RepID=UPI0024A284B1|nr:amino acid adenylation domain-containing protein [Microtetraspora sp. NBRC 16547]GLX00437.1 hypothetical protein Misp02_45230 [Microtetraspora sp. NBRC 16547]